MFDALTCVSGRERAGETVPVALRIAAAQDYDEYVDGKPRYEGSSHSSHPRGIDAAARRKPTCQYLLQPAYAEKVGLRLGQRQETEIVLRLGPRNGASQPINEGSVRPTFHADQGGGSRGSGSRRVIQPELFATVLIAGRNRDMFEVRHRRSSPRASIPWPARNRIRSSPAASALGVESGSKRLYSRTSLGGGWPPAGAGRFGSVVGKRPRRAGRGDPRARADVVVSESERAAGVIVIRHAHRDEAVGLRETEARKSEASRDRVGLCPIRNGAHRPERETRDEGEAARTAGNYLNALYEASSAAYPELGTAIPRAGKNGRQRGRNGKIVRSSSTTSRSTSRTERARSRAGCSNLRAERGPCGRTADGCSRRDPAERLLDEGLVSFVQRSVVAIAYEVRPSIRTSPSVQVRVVGQRAMPSVARKIASPCALTSAAALRAWRGIAALRRCSCTRPSFQAGC